MVEQYPVGKTNKGHPIPFYTSFLFKIQIRLKFDVCLLLIVNIITNHYKLYNMAEIIPYFLV